MSLRGPRRITVLMLSAVMPLISTAADSTTTRDQIAQTSTALEQMESALAASEQSVQQALDALSVIYDEQARIEKDLSQARKKTRSLNAQKQAAEMEIRGLNQRTATLRRDIERLQTQQNRQLLLIQKVEPPGLLKAMLNGESPTRALHQLRLFKVLFESQKALAQQLYANNRALLEQHKKQAAEVQRLSDVGTALEGQRKSLQAMLSQRHALTVELETKLSNEQLRVAELATNRSRLTELLSKLQISQQTSTVPFSSQRGALPVPLKDGRLKYRFGQTPANKTTPQSGLFFTSQASQSSRNAAGSLAEIGTLTEGAVTAVHDGKLIYSAPFRGYGLLAIVDHGEGYYTLYANNDELMRSAGVSVRRGDLLARAARHGDEVGLYFELREQGRPIDPLKWLQSQ